MRSVVAAYCAGLTLAAAPANPLAALSVSDLDGVRVDPFHNATASATVFLFLRTDCPISNSYAPAIQQLHARFAPQGVAFWIVYLDPDQDARAIRQHLAEFKIPGIALRDFTHALVKRCGVRVTPEAAVFSGKAELSYAGRIDDRYAAYGKQKPAATTHDLQDALAATVAGRTAAKAKGPAIGCPIGDLR